MPADRYVERMTSLHPLIEATSLGECWLAVSALILAEGTDALYDAQPIKEIALLTLSASSTDPSDPIIDRYGDPAWLQWMHANFFDHADVPELGNAASYATRLFDYARSGRNQIEWVTERLRTDPNCKIAAITTFTTMPTAVRRRAGGSAGGAGIAAAGALCGLLSETRSTLRAAGSASAGGRSSNAEGAGAASGCGMSNIARAEAPSMDE